MSSRQTGFTLIELVISIVVIGILSVGTMRFIAQSTQGYSDAADRQQLATVGWLIAEKVSRELRDALPNSFRLSTGGSCIEFVPTRSGSDYLSVPILSAANNFEVVPMQNYAASDVDSTRDRVAVYPNTVAGLYTLPNPGTISPKISSLAAGTTANAIRVNLSSNHQFLTDSPTRRMYVVSNPVSFCFSGSKLYRYSDYGYLGSQATTVAGGLANEVVIGAGLTSGQFSYSPGTLSRNGVVSFAFSVSGNSTASQAINQEVQIRNVP